MEFKMHHSKQFYRQFFKLFVCTAVIYSGTSVNAMKSQYIDQWFSISYPIKLEPYEPDYSSFPKINLDGERQWCVSTLQEQLQSKVQESQSLQSKREELLKKLADLELLNQSKNEFSMHLTYSTQLKAPLRQKTLAEKSSILTDSKEKCIKKKQVLKQSKEQLSTELAAREVLQQLPAPFIVKILYKTKQPSSRRIAKMPSEKDKSQATPSWTRQ